MTHETSGRDAICLHKAGIHTPCDTKYAAEQSAKPLGDDDNPPEGIAVHGDEHERGIATGDEDVDGAVVGDAQNTAHERHHEKTGHRREQRAMHQQKRKRREKISPSRHIIAALTFT